MSVKGPLVISKYCTDSYIVTWIMLYDIYIEIQPVNKLTLREVRRLVYHLLVDLIFLKITHSWKRNHQCYPGSKYPCQATISQLIFYWDQAPEMRLWTSNYIIKYFWWDVKTCPWTDLNCSLGNTKLNFGHGWLIFPRAKIITLWSLAAPEVVIMTTSNDNSDNKVGIMTTTLGFQCDVLLET